MGPENFRTIFGLIFRKFPGHFSHFPGHFSPIFQVRPKSIFRPFSSFPFRAGGPKWIYTRSTGFQGKPASDFSPVEKRHALLRSVLRRVVETAFQKVARTDLFSRVLFSFLPSLLATPLPPFLWAFFRPWSPPRKVLCSVEQRAQHTAWRGAVSGWTSPERSGRKFLPEICVKKGQSNHCR